MIDASLASSASVLVPKPLESFWDDNVSASSPPRTAPDLHLLFCSKPLQGLRDTRRDVGRAALIGPLVAFFEAL
jgi:hypothetical protein